MEYYLCCSLFVPFCFVAAVIMMFARLKQPDEPEKPKDPESSSPSQPSPLSSRPTGAYHNKKSKMLSSLTAHIRARHARGEGGGGGGDHSFSQRRPLPWLLVPPRSFLYAAAAAAVFVFLLLLLLVASSGWGRGSGSGGGLFGNFRNGHEVSVSNPKEIEVGFSLPSLSLGTKNSSGGSCWNRRQQQQGTGVGGAEAAGLTSISTLPQCYSSPEANPSDGAWQKCEGGVDESPVDMVTWSHPINEFGFLHKCQSSWSSKHKGEGPRPYWVWEPEKCSLETVNAEKFCRVMEGRKGILFVGDSLTRLSTTTLASILRAKSVVNKQTKDVWLACDGALTVRFMRSDFLDVRAPSEATGKNGSGGGGGGGGGDTFRTIMCEDEKGQVIINSRCVVFASDEVLRESDTLVVNSGAHVRPIDEEYRPAMEAASKALTASMKRIHGEDAIMIVRNTPPGHWGCTERIHDGPVDYDVAMKMIATSPPSFDWDTFQDRNAVLEDAFLSPEGSGGGSGSWQLLDAYSPTLLRADSHIGGRDCLHYCAPGPADHWVVLLYNMLLVATTSDHDTQGNKHP